MSQIENVNSRDSFVILTLPIVSYTGGLLGFSPPLLIWCLLIVYFITSNWSNLSLQFCVRLFLSAIVKLFFREVHFHGQQKIPIRGPLIFVCAPHNNQFIDPILVMQLTQRQIGFLIAAKSMRRRYVGMLAKILGAVPVERTQDLAIKGSGKVKLTNGNKIIGIGTKFKTESKIGYSLIVKSPNTSEPLVIADIKSDSEIELTHSIESSSNDSRSKNNSFKSPLNTSIAISSASPKSLKVLNSSENSSSQSSRSNSNQLSPISSRTQINSKIDELLYSYSIAPKIDQHEVFSSVWSSLDSGKCIGIFPEGGSHDRTEFLPLKAGVSIMALGCKSAKDVKIVPVGLNYFSGHKFRSRAYIDIGDPLILNKELIDLYKNSSSSAEKKQACKQLMETIHKSLLSVTTQAPSIEVLRLCWAIRRLYAPNGLKLTLDQKLELTRRFQYCYSFIDTEPKLKLLMRKVENYVQRLNSYGLRDYQVYRSDLTISHTFPILGYRLLILIIYSIAAFPGMILNAPIGIAAKIISHYKMREAKATSSVKIEGRDVVATWKIMCASALVPLCLIIYPSIISLIGYYYIPSIGAFQLWSWFSLVQLPIMYSSVRFTEVGYSILRSLKPLLLSVTGNRKIIESLKEERKELQIEIRSLVSELGEKFFGKNFTSTRLFKHEDIETIEAEQEKLRNDKFILKSPLTKNIINSISEQNLFKLYNINQTKLDNANNNKRQATEMTSTTHLSTSDDNLRQRNTNWHLHVEEKTNQTKSD